MAAADPIGDLLISRPEKDGSVTTLLLTHRAGQIDFKLNPVVQNADGTWNYFDTFSDPETTGYFKIADGGELQLFAQAPKKWCMKFSPQADGTWKCTNANDETAAATNIKPGPSLLGAGGLPKGMINLGEEQDDGFNMLF